MISMRKMRMPLLILATILVVVPLLGVACSDDEGGTTTTTAKFSASPESGLGPLTVTFTDQSVGDIDNYEWDFNGDGVADSTDQNPSYTFELGAGLTAKTYTVVLTVTYADGSTDQATKVISVTPVDYPDMKLTISYPMPSSQVESQPANKFAELMELYTGGDVTVEVYGGGSLFTYGEDWTAVQDGSMVDIIWTSPYFMAMFDINLNPYGPYQFLYSNHEHVRTVMEDGRVDQIVDGLLAESGVKLLGYTTSVLVAAYLNTVRETDDFEDFNGLRFGSLAPGLMDPFHEYYGCTEVYVGGMGEVVSLAQGMYDMSGTSLCHVTASGILPYHKHALLTIQGLPMIAMMNLDAWDSLGADLQSLITDVIWPEVMAYANDTVLEESKEEALIMAEALETVHVLSLERGAEILEEVMTAEGHAGDRLRDLRDALDPDILEIIEELRPANPQIDPEVIEIFDYAGIQY